MKDDYPIAAPCFPLETERLMLREIVTGDFDDIYGYAADPEVTRYMVWGPNTPDQTRVAMAEWLSQQAVWPRNAVNLAVELKSQRIVIGTIRLEVRDPANRSADFGYTYDRHFWGQGLATEAARAVLSAGFTQLGTAQDLGNLRRSEYWVRERAAKAWDAARGAAQARRPRAGRLAGHPALRDPRGGVDRPVKQAPAC